jgi:integrase
MAQEIIDILLNSFLIQVSTNPFSYGLFLIYSVILGHPSISIPLLTRCLPLRTKLTPSFVLKATADAGAERTVFWDETLPGFGLMVTKAGSRSFVLQYRAGKRSRRMTFPFTLGLDKARREARRAVGGVAGGGDPLQERRKAEARAENTLQSICEEYIRREGKRLRSTARMSADLERLVYPRLGARQIDSILRSDLVRLLDRIADNQGPVMADRILAHTRKILNRHAARSDDFRSPVVRGMAHSRPHERQRDRILDDDELRAVWKAAEASTGAFGYLVRFILLTVTRRNEAARMADTELSGEDWIIPGVRYKTKVDHVVPLSAAARKVLASIPRIKNVRYIFTTRTQPIGGFSRFKSGFDETCGVTGWVLHDLRRTGRSLMSRAGVDADHAERCLGHVIGGVRGTYDRYGYLIEKRQAFEALAAQIDRIINPQPNVIPMRNSEIPA